MKKRVFSLLFLTCILLGISACKPDAECMEPEESPRVETPDKHAFLMERGYPAEYLENLIDLQLESLYNMVMHTFMESKKDLRPLKSLYQTRSTPSRQMILTLQSCSPTQRINMTIYNTSIS